MILLSIDEQIDFGIDFTIWSSLLSDRLCSWSSFLFLKNDFWMFISLCGFGLNRKAFPRRLCGYSHSFHWPSDGRLWLYFLWFTIVCDFALLLSLLIFLSLIIVCQLVFVHHLYDSRKLCVFSDSFLLTTANWHRRPILTICQNSHLSSSQFFLLKLLKHSLLSIALAFMQRIRAKLRIHNWDQPNLCGN